MKCNYSDYPELSALYLEDSYVLGISESRSSLEFILEAVLTPQHPAYHEPAENEQYCYARGRLIFGTITDIDWKSRNFQKYTDADGETDYGNIDTLTNNDGVFSVTGDWGQVRISSRADPTFELST